MPTRERRVLLIEDDAFIAMELCDVLERAGYRVAGPAGTGEQARRLIEEQAPELAIVDIRLRDGGCADAALALRRRGVKLLVHSGCGESELLAAGLGDAPRLSKPAWPGDVVSVLDALSRPEAPGASRRPAR